MQKQNKYYSKPYMNINNCFCRCYLIFIKTNQKWSGNIMSKQFKFKKKKVYFIHC